MGDRFVRTADTVAALQDERAARLADDVRSFIHAMGDERALDSGCGAGALALALAPLVRAVVGVDRVDELLELARRRAPANATFVAGDVTALPFADAEFDLAATLRVLHHVDRPDRVVAELARVTRPGGNVLVVDQLADADAETAAAVERFERARDPGHARLLSEGELLALFERSGLAVVRSRIVEEQRDVERYLDHAGCTGAARDEALALAPPGYHHRVGWFLAARAAAEARD